MFDASPLCAFEWGPVAEVVAGGPSGEAGLCAAGKGAGTTLDGCVTAGVAPGFQLVAVQAHATNGPANAFWWGGGMRQETIFDGRQRVFRLGIEGIAGWQRVTRHGRISVGFVPQLYFIKLGPAAGIRVSFFPW